VADILYPHVTLAVEGIDQDVSLNPPKLPATAVASHDVTMFQPSRSSLM